MLGIDAELQKELIEFVKTSQSDKTPRPLKVHLVEELLKQIVEGEREITGLITGSLSDGKGAMTND